MKFNTVAEAYGFYRNSSVETMEARAKAINADIAGNADADITAYNVELEGIEQAITEKRGQNQPSGAMGIMQTAGEPVDAGEGASSKIYRSAFYKHLTGKKLTDAERHAFELVNTEKRGNAFNKLSDTAAVILTTTLNEIITKAREQGGIMGISRGFNMPSGIAVPVATPGSASWHVEGAAVETEKASVTSVVFAANEIMRVLSISAAVRTMSIDAFESYLADELTASVMNCLGKTMVDGDGSGQGEGIIEGITWVTSGDGQNAVEVAADASLAYTDITSAIALLKRGYGTNAKFVMNNATLYGDVYGLCDDNDRPIFVADATEPGKGRILGFEVVVDDFMADHDILFGNFRYMGYNLAGGIALDVSRDSSFTKGLIDYRALAVADCKPIVDEAFVLITKAAAETTTTTGE